ncbi:MAG: 2-oxoacid:acceptor oxidoreductase subunit alpha, partial [Chloroflexota bacterium]
FVDVWPFPAEAARQALAGARRLVGVEANATAQFAALLQVETGIRMDQKILRYDGRELTAAYILARVEGR